MSLKGPHHPVHPHMGTCHPLRGHGVPVQGHTVPMHPCMGPYDPCTSPYRAMPSSKLPQCLYTGPQRPYRSQTTPVHLHMGTCHPLRCRSVPIRPYCPCASPRRAVPRCPLLSPGCPHLGHGELLVQTHGHVQREVDSAARQEEEEQHLLGTPHEGPP